MLNIIDYGIIFIYVSLILLVGCGSAWLQKRKREALGADQDDGAYFLAARTLKWPIIGLSLFSTNISTMHIVGLAEQGYMTGMAYANFELAAVFTLVVLAVFFVPFYLRSHVTTLPDFLEKRYSRSCRDFLAFVSIVSAIFIHIGVSLYAGGAVINALMGWSTELTALVPTMVMIALTTGLYVVVGGLLAVTLTDAIQTTTLLIGSTVITFFAFDKLGDWQTLHDTVGPQMLSVVRHGTDFSGLPWHAVLVGYPVIGIWYWCTDQTIVQRVLGAKDEHHGKAGALFAAFLKLLPMFVFVLPGLLCLALINQGMIPPLMDSKEAFSHMVIHLLPSGMRGVIVAALLAALMGTIAGALNSIATLFAFDLYKRFKPNTTDGKLVHVGRLATVTSVILAILWSPIISQFETIFEAIVSMVCYVAPPITAVFTVGIFWPRATSKAAVCTLWSGFAMGVVVFILELFKEQTGWQLGAMHASGILCALCALILIVISLADEDTNTDENRSVTWDSPLTPLRIKGNPGLLNYKFLAAMALLAASVLYFLFRQPSPEALSHWKTANPEHAAKIEAHIHSSALDEPAMKTEREEP